MQIERATVTIYTIFVNCNVNCLPSFFYDFVKHVSSDEKSTTRNTAQVPGYIDNVIDNL